MGVLPLRDRLHRITVLQCLEVMSRSMIFVFEISGHSREACLFPFPLKLAVKAMHRVRDHPVIPPFTIAESGGCPFQARKIRLRAIVKKIGQCTAALKNIKRKFFHRGGNLRIAQARTF